MKFFPIILSLLLLITVKTYSQVKFIYDDTSRPNAVSSTALPLKNNFLPSKNIGAESLQPSRLEQPQEKPVILADVAYAQNTSESGESVVVKVPPPTDLSTNAEFEGVIKKLKKIAKAKDGKALLEMIYSEIRFGSSGEYQYGKALFEQTWKPISDKSPVWKYLDEVLQVGGAYYRQPHTGEVTQNEVILPYVCNINIDPIYMYSDMLVITSEAANIRKQPLLKSPVVGKFSYDLVKVQYDKSFLPSLKSPLGAVKENGLNDWYYVSSLDGKQEGYVNWNVAWDPRGMRIHLIKSEGNWYIGSWIERE